MTAYANDSLIVRPRASVSILQPNGVRRYFRARGNFRLSRKLSPAEEGVFNQLNAHEQSLVSVTVIWDRPETIYDESPIPSSAICARLWNETPVTVSNLDLGTQAFFLRFVEGRGWTNSRMDAWMAKARDPNFEVEFTVSWRSEGRRNNQTVLLMSKSEEDALHRELQATSSDPVTGGFERARIYCAHHLFEPAKVEVGKVWMAEKDVGVE